MEAPGAVHLYQGDTRQFIDDAVQNRIAGKLRAAFFAYYRYQPGPGEVRSWQNSLSRMCNVLQHGGFLEHGLALEYQLPLTSRRLDFLLTGQSPEEQQHAVIIELKQWDEVLPSSVDDCVVTHLGGRLRDVLHPSKQVGNYREYLEDCHTAFSEDGIALSACSFLHNVEYDPAHELFHDRHRTLIERCPVFPGDRALELEAYLRARVGEPDRTDVLARVLESRYRPGKKLLDHVAQVLRRQKVYVLLDDQQVVFNTVVARVREGFEQRRKSVMLVRGGPGTGKSVIALHLVADLAARGLNAQHATGSRAFTQNVRKLVGSRAGAQFRYFNSFSGAEPGAVDVLVLDEAHRIRATSGSRFTPKERRTNLPQIDELLRVSKVLVVFIDDLQGVRPGEVGDSALVRAAAVRGGATLTEFELDAQFRCNGSDGFINWVDNTLGIRRTANVLWDSKDAFDFRIVDSIGDLDALIRQRAGEDASARLTAGFCFPWSDPKEDGTLVHDVVVGEWSMPWNAKPDSTRLAAGIPKSHFWSSDRDGLNQVGCVYTAQGFEFDYVGVIFGSDLRYDPQRPGWSGERAASFDREVKRDAEAFTTLVKQAYRVLLTRGLKGCYVHFLDRSTRDFVASRIE
ncbi:MAG: DUF2075 domain-containing protein [Planctomycetaceae bacterium]